MNAKYCPCLSVKLFPDIVTQSIHLRLSRRRGKMNIRYRVELSEAERSELGSAPRWPACSPQAQASSDPAGGRRRGAGRDHCPEPRCGRSTVYRTKRLCGGHSRTAAAKLGMEYGP